VKGTSLFLERQPSRYGDKVGGDKSGMGAGAMRIRAAKAMVEVVASEVEVFVAAAGPVTGRHEQNGQKGSVRSLFQPGSAQILHSTETTLYNLGNVNSSNMA
jgi:hypothetical protein